MLTMDRLVGGLCLSLVLVPADRAVAQYTPPGSNVPAAAASGAATAVPAGANRNTPAVSPQNQNVAPFELAPQQQRFIDELLAAWEQQSRQIKTFQCNFARWEYDPLVGPHDAKGNLMAAIISKGELRYVQPDKGLFKVGETHAWDTQSKAYRKAPADANEHWICDGRTVWQLDARKRQLIENPLPPEMVGMHIADGPLPFLLFGGEAAKIKARYYLRERTDPQYAQEEIWLEAYPKWRNDAANFKMSQLIMKRAKFQPYALRLYSPNGRDYTVFEFTNVVLNNPSAAKGLTEPPIPSGWQKVRNPPPGNAAAANAQAAADQPNRQAERPASKFAPLR